MDCIEYTEEEQKQKIVEYIIKCIEDADEGKIANVSRIRNSTETFWLADDFEVSVEDVAEELEKRGYKIVEDWSH